MMVKLSPPFRKNVFLALNMMKGSLYGAGVPASETVGPQIWDYGETIADDFVFILCEECSPSDDPYELFEDDELTAKQVNIMCEIEESLSEDDLTSRGIPEDYLNLAKGFVEYGMSRMEGGG